MAASAVSVVVVLVDALAVETGLPIAASAVEVATVVPIDASVVLLVDVETDKADDRAAFFERGTTSSLGGKVHAN